ncbi:MAG: hypothetical protein LBH86_07135 [Oscillospiraceae bacterium]|nr:hypothetical protein [Oscillospiraceae bacterium]
MDLAINQKGKETPRLKVKVPVKLAPSARRAVLGKGPFALTQERLLQAQKRALALPEDHPERIAAAAAARERLLLAGVLDADGNLTEFYRE